MEAESQAGSGTPFDGTFRILDELGRGARGVVYHALQQPLEEPVAIKVLHERLGEDAPGREQFNQEVRAFAGLDHPNLVSIGSFGIEGEAPYIVMELLDGETVAARLARGPIDPAEAETLIQTLLRAVAHLHLRGLVHRNLSPGSMFLHRKDDREQLKLIDYGLSHFAENTDAGRAAPPSPYVSPEQAAGDDTDARTDVYAAGAIMMRLFGADPQPSAANDNGSLRPAARIHPGASPQLDALVARALAPNRQDRFGNADQMLKALLELPSPWIDAEAIAETSENDAIPVLSNVPASEHQTTEVAVAEEAPAGARHNTPPPIPASKRQAVPVLKMIGAAVLGALLAGGGVAFWVARKESVQKVAEASKPEQRAPAGKVEAKQAENGEHPQPAQKPEPPKPDEPLLKIKEESEHEKAQGQTPAADKQAHGEKADQHEVSAEKSATDKHESSAEKTAVDRHEPSGDKPTPGKHESKADKPAPSAHEAAPAATARDDKRSEPAPAAHDDKHSPPPTAAHGEAAPAAHAEAEHSAAHGGEPQPPTAADKHAEAEHAAANATPAQPTAADKHAEPAPAPAEQKPEAPPPPPGLPIGAVRHVKPLASEIRMLLTMAQQPRKPRAKAEDPWGEATMPSALESLRRSIDNGEPGSPNQISALRHYNTANPDDVHGHLLLAGLYKNRGWDADALDEYDMAYQIDSSSRGAPEMLSHALFMVAHDEATDDAMRFIVRAYQREALAPIDRAIHDSKEPAVRARLKKLRARVQAGR